jgi:7-carboxy-7-deazaguanine synthase (Cx14CxxC type)
MSPYHVKEIFYTLQGEGANAGRPAVFCRFTGCNLWSGRETDRETAACRFCDTDFLGTDGPGGGTFNSAKELADAIRGTWPDLSGQAFVVCTGGEPLLQLDDELVRSMHARGMQVAIETNGTRVPPRGIDWICVSPKAEAPPVLRAGDELKLVYPQPGAEPESFEGLKFRYFYLQPMDGADRQKNTRLALRYCLKHPQWRLSIQTHKVLGIS